MRAEYRYFVVQINWVATNSRPVIAFDACEFSSLCNRAPVNKLLRLNKLIDRVQGNCNGLIFPQFAVLEECHLEVFSDASLGNMADGSSQAGFLVFLRDVHGVRCLVL